MRFKLLILFLIPLFSIGQKTTRFFAGENFGIDIDTTVFKPVPPHDIWKNLDPDFYDFKYLINDSVFILASIGYVDWGKCSEAGILKHLQGIPGYMAGIRKDDSTKTTEADIKNYNQFIYLISLGGISSIKEKPWQFANNLWAYRCYGSKTFVISCEPSHKTDITDNDLVQVFKHLSTTNTFYTDDEVENATAQTRMASVPKIHITDTVNYEGTVWLEGDTITITAAVFFNDSTPPVIFFPAANNRVHFLLNKTSQNTAPVSTGFFIVKNALGMKVRCYFNFAKEFKQ